VNSLKYRHTLHAFFFFFFSLAAKAGLPKAQCYLGEMCENNWADRAKAAEWYQKGMLSRILQDIKTFSALPSPAAKAGDTNAQLNLASMLRFGVREVEANPIMAVEWLQKGMLLQIPQKINALSALPSPAAEAGLPEIRDRLGCMYRDGDGVEANLVKAVYWYRKGTLLQILQKYQHAQRSPFTSCESRIIDCPQESLAFVLR
jgi:Sel1 repeat